MVAPSPADYQSSNSFLVRCCRTADEVLRLQPAWVDLAQAAIEPNPFYEPWALLPAWRELGQSAQWQAVFVFQAAPHGEGTLCGFFPIERFKILRRIDALRLYNYEHCALNTPLVRTGKEAETLTAFFDWCASPEAHCAALEFNRLGMDGPFAEQFADELSRRSASIWSMERYTRGVCKLTGGGKAYIEQTLSGKTRKHLRRSRELLQEVGAIEFVALSEDRDLLPWVREFLELEAAGWKGKVGSPILPREQHRRFFEAMAVEGFREGRFMISALRLNGRMIACRVLLRAADRLFVFKIAYDEAYSRYSPGLLLEMASLEQPELNRGLRWTDSCAARSNTNFKRIWQERRIIERLLVATTVLGEFAVAVSSLWSWIGRTLRAFASRKPKKAEAGQS
jgi:CelD/BcsL family acetyltransferase involved in cellulose biosynthesis